MAAARSSPQLSVTPCGNHSGGCFCIPFWGGFMSSIGQSGIKMETYTIKLKTIDGKTIYYRYGILNIAEVFIDIKEWMIGRGIKRVEIIKEERRKS